MMTRRRNVTASVPLTSRKESWWWAAAAFVAGALAAVLVTMALTTMIKASEGTPAPGMIEFIKPGTIPAEGIFVQARAWVI